MGVVRNVIKPGDGTNYPRKGQTVSVHYTGIIIIVAIRIFKRF